MYKLFGCTDIELKLHAKNEFFQRSALILYLDTIRLPDTNILVRSSDDIREEMIPACCSFSAQRTPCHISLIFSGSNSSMYTLLP